MNWEYPQWWMIVLYFLTIMLLAFFLIMLTDRELRHSVGAWLGWIPRSIKRVFTHSKTKTTEPSPARVRVMKELVLLPKGYSWRLQAAEIQSDYDELRLYKGRKKIDYEWVTRDKGRYDHDDFHSLFQKSKKLYEAHVKVKEETQYKGEYGVYAQEIRKYVLDKDDTPATETATMIYNEATETVTISDELIEKLREAIK
jgi:hypothetical protein